MTEKYRQICFCQTYNLKSDVEGILDFFRAEKSPQRKKATRKYVAQFLDPSVSYQKIVGSVDVLLHVILAFSPKQYLDRAKELLTATKMTKATTLFVQERKEHAQKFLKADAKFPPALFFALRVRDELGSGFSSDVIPKILKVKLIKSNLEFLLKKVYRRSRHGYVCPIFQYDASKMKVVGGIIPARLPVPKLISNKLGEPTLDSITLSFEDSPIGLEKVEITKENGHLVLELKITRRVNNFKDIYPKVLNEAKEIAKLMLERVA